MAERAPRRGSRVSRRRAASRLSQLHLSGHSPVQPLLERRKGPGGTEAGDAGEVEA